MPATLEGWFDLALWLAGLGHFVILAAAAQVPFRLGWKADLAKLTTFNRKVFRTYAAYIFGTILSFGVLTLALHDELLRGDRAALGLAAFMGVFWVARVVIDFTYFGHDDWPPGRAFRVGHILLTGLFVALSGTYLGLVAWHLG